MALYSRSLPVSSENGACREFDVSNEKLVDQSWSSLLSHLHKEKKNTDNSILDYC